MMVVPTMAMLKVLEPELSNELRVIAVNHFAQAHKVEAAAITIEDAWVREFWNAKVDVYMVEATVDKGLTTQQKIQVPVRVDQKVVLTDTELNALQEEDNRFAPNETVIRAMSGTQTKSEPVAAEDAVTEVTPGANNMFYYVVAVGLAVLLATATLLIRRKALTIGGTDTVAPR